MVGIWAALQFQATHSREPVIEDQTITTTAGKCVQKLLRRCVTHCIHASYFEQTPKGSTDLTFVVDGCDPMFRPPSFIWKSYLASAARVYWPLVLHIAIRK